MGTIQTDQLRGLITIPPRLSTLDNVDPAESSFSEAAPRPGGSRAVDAGTKLRPEVSGDQTIDAELEVRRGGNPSEIDGAAVALRASGGLEDDWTGWSSPNWIAAWKPIRFTTTPIPDHEWDLVTRSESQEVIAVFREGGAIATVHALHPEDPQIDEWTARGTIAGTVGAGPLALAELPSGRLLCFVGPSTMKYSDDAGSTWSLYSAALGLIGGGRATMAIDRDLVAFFDEGTAANEISQWLSRDLGVSFERVSQNLGIGSSPEVVSIPGGGLIVAYEAAGGDTEVVLLEDAAQPFSSGDTVTIDAGVLAGQLGIYADADGLIFVYGRTADDELACYRSTDGGSSWLPYSGGVAFFDDNQATIERGRAVGMQGYAVLANQWSGFGVAPREHSIGAFILGGSENVENGGSDQVTLAGEVDRSGYGAASGLVWFPAGLPDDLSWSHNGPANSGALLDPGEMILSTALQADYYSVLLGPTLGSEVVFQFRGPLGGSTLATDCGLRLRVADNANEYRAWFNWGGDSFSIFDGVSGLQAGATQTPGFLADLEIRIRVNPGGQLASAWRSRAVGLDAVTNPWILGPSGSLVAISGGPAASQGRIQFGHILGAGLMNSAWSLVAVSTDSGNLLSLPGTAQPLIGKRLGGVFPYPWPGIGSRERSARVALRAGPAPVDERFALDSAHDHSIAHLFPALSPNPEETWRDNDEALVEQVVAWDLGENTRIAQVPGLALCILRNNFQTCYLEVETSPAVWLTLGTWNGAAGFESLSFTRDGDILKPAPSTSIAGRVLQRNELAGGVAIAGGVARRIAGHAAGRWGGTFDSVLPYLRLEDSSGFPASGADLALVAPRGVMFTWLPGASPFWRRVRIRIPGQPVPEAYKEAGLALVGGFSPFGQQYSRGWSHQMRPNVERRRSPAGVIRKRQLGKPSIRWSMAWPDGVKLSESRKHDATTSAEASPDYLGPGDELVPGLGLPVVNEQDVWGQLFGILEEIRGGELPVVAVAKAPAFAFAGGAPISPVTITDRTLFLYGTWEGSPQFNQVLGEEGVDEFGRIEGISVDGIEG